MKKIFLQLIILFSLTCSAQSYKDTTFSVREYSCNCKYNLIEQDDNGLFDLHGRDASYPGGAEEWKKFLKKNIDKGFKGKHMVEVKFTVDKNGDLSGFTVLNNTAAQKYEEVLRVLKLSGKWFPSLQKGFCVKSVVVIKAEL